MTQNPLLNSLNPISAKDLKLKINQNCLIVDTRFIHSIFQTGSIPDAIFIGVQGKLEYWSQILIQDKSTEIYLITEENIDVNELHLRFLQAGFNKVKGFLNGGMEAWKIEGFLIEPYYVIHPKEFIKQLDSIDFQTIIDVRTEQEFQYQYIEGSQNIPLEILHQQSNNLDSKSNYYMLCLGGYRSVLAASILKRKGIKNTIDIYGGLKNFQ